VQESFGRIVGGWLKKQANHTAESYSSQALSGLMNWQGLWLNFYQGKNVSAEVGVSERKKSDKWKKCGS